MTKTQVIDLLKQNRNKRGMAKWKKMTPDRIKLKSFGIGLTHLRKLANQVENLDGGVLSHVFSSCDATLAKAPFAFDLANDWMASQDPMPRRRPWSRWLRRTLRGAPA